MDTYVVMKSKRHFKVWWPQNLVILSNSLLRPALFFSTARKAVIYLLSYAPAKLPTPNWLKNDEVIFVSRRCAKPGAHHWWDKLPSHITTLVYTTTLSSICGFELTSSQKGNISIGKRVNICSEYIYGCWIPSGGINKGLPVVLYGGLQDVSFVNCKLLPEPFLQAPWSQPLHRTGS